MLLSQDMLSRLLLIVSPITPVLLAAKNPGKTEIFCGTPHLCGGENAVSIGSLTEVGPRQMDK